MALWSGRVMWSMGNFAAQPQPPPSGEGGHAA